MTLEDDVEALRRRHAFERGPDGRPPWEEWARLADALDADAAVALAREKAPVVRCAGVMLVAWKHPDRVKDVADSLLDGSRMRERFLDTGNTVDGTVAVALLNALSHASRAGAPGAGVALLHVAEWAAEPLRGPALEAASHSAPDAARKMAVEWVRSRVVRTTPRVAHALLVCGSTSAREAQDEIVAIAKERDAPGHVSAITALGGMDPAVARPILEPLVKSSSEPIRRAALAAWKRLGLDPR